MSEDTKMEVVTDEATEAVETKLPLKSEILNEHKSLLEKNDELVKELQAREYEIEFKNKKMFDTLLKFLEKKAPWNNRTAAGLILLYHNLREEKDKTRAKDWDGKIALRSANAAILWQMLSMLTGEGFYEAKNFVELMATIGEPVSKAVAAVQKENQVVRDNHTRLSELDNIIDARAWEDDTDMEREDYANLDVDEIDPVTE